MFTAGKIDSAAKLEGALTYLKTIGGDAAVEGELHKAAGVGVVVTDADVTAAVAACLADYQEAFAAERYRGPKGPALAQLKRTIPFADPKRVLEQFELQLEAMLGPMTEQDKQPPVKAKVAAVKPAAAAAAAPAAAAAESSSSSSSSDVVSTRDWKLPHPRENIDSGDGCVTRHVSYVTCHMLHVTRHMLYVTCHMSHVTRHAPLPPSPPSPPHFIVFARIHGGGGCMHLHRSA